MPHPLDDITVEDINKSYHDGYRSATDKNNLLRLKAELTVGQMLEQKGPVVAIIERSVKHLNEGWENLKEAATHDTTDSFTSVEGYKKNLKAVGLAFWGQVQMLTSVMNAVGEVSGAAAEKLALAAGAPPGLAKVINVAVDVGTGFVPVGTAARSFAKGVQGIQKAGAAKATAKAAEATAKAEAKQAEKIVEDAIADGLKADGVVTSVKEPAAVSEEVMRRGKEFLGKGEQAAKANYEKWFEQAQQRMKQEGIGQNILENLDEIGRTPKQVIDDFWKYTYDNLPPEVKTKFEKYIKNVTGLEPGMAIASGPGGEKIIGKTWKDIYTASDAPNLAEHLEGTERGLIALMEMASQGVAGGVFKQGATQAAAPLLEQAVKQLTPQEEFYKALQKYRREMAQITETKTHAMTKAEADKLGIGLEDLQNLIPGTALKEAEMAAYLKALDSPVDNLIALGKQTLAGVEGAGELFTKQLVEFFNYSPKFRAAEVTAGRSVEILKETPPMKAITDMLMGWAPESLAKGDFKTAMATIAEDIVAMSEKPGALKALQLNATQTIQAHGFKRFNEVSREIYYNVLLSRPLTAVKNFIGNLYAAADLTAERALGSMFSLDKKNLYDRANPMSNEAYYQFNGYLSGIGDGLKAYGDAFKHFSPEEASKLDFVPHKIGGVLGRVINAPGDNLRGMDGFFKAMLHRGDLYAQASRMGQQNGLKADELADYVARRVNFPTNEMTAQAKAFAQNGTFQNDLGTFGQWLTGLQKGPLWTLFPFMKTPINLTKFVWNRMPGTSLLSRSLYEDIKAGGARADMAIGRLTLANLTGMFYFGLAQQGLITGGGPADAQLRRQWSAVNQPYSIKGKNKWFTIPALEPATTSMFIMADFAEAMNQMDDPTAEQTAMALMLAGTRDIVDKSYWQTFGDINELISASRSGEGGSQMVDIGLPVPVPKFTVAPLTTIGSLGPITGAAARIADPVRREARSFVDMWRARIPGYSKDLAPTRDGYGDEILIPQALGPDWLGIIHPFTAIGIDTDEIKKEGARLQVKLPQFPYSIGGGKNEDTFDINTAQPGDPMPVELSGKQRDRWQVIYRNFIRSDATGIKKNLLENEQYQQAEYALQRQMFMSYLSQSRSAAKEVLMAEDVNLQKKLFNAQAGSVLPLVPRGQRQEVEQQFTDSMDMFDGLTPEQQDNLMRWGILDTGEERDREQRSMKLEINKSIPELNAGATATPPPTR